MPELPEVEAHRRAVERCCKGLEIVGINAKEQGGGPRDGQFDDLVLAESSGEEEVASKLVGAKVSGAQRKGKQLWILLEKDGAHDRALLLHFGMTGSLLIHSGAEIVAKPSYVRFAASEQWPAKFCKLELKFAGGVSLAFSDPRRLGRVLVREGDASVQLPICKLARDPLNDPPLLEELQVALARIHAPIKAVLLDQERVVSGVGNWVADEVLFQSAILPSAPCSSLSCAQVASLRQCLISVVAKACEVDAESEKFPADWLFHYRWQNKTAGTQKSPLGIIHFATVGGRTTAFVPARQRKGAGQDSAPDASDSKERHTDDAKASGRKKRRLTNHTSSQSRKA